VGFAPKRNVLLLTKIISHDIEGKRVISSITFDDISPTYLPVSKLKGLVDFLNDLGICCTFFVVPIQNYSPCLRSEFAACLRFALSHGHELSLHGYEHIKNEFGYFYPIPLPVIPIPSFEKQKERIASAKKALTQLAGVEPLGFRSPFYLYNNATYEALSVLNFKYDSSKTIFKPTHGIRWRIRWVRNLGPYKVHDIVEIPVSGDYLYNVKNEDIFTSIRRALSDFAWIRSRNGVFVMNIHPHKLSSTSLQRFLHMFVSKILDKTEFVKLMDIDLLKGCDNS